MLGAEKAEEVDAASSAESVSSAAYIAIISRQTAARVVLMKRQMTTAGKKIPKKKLCIADSS